MVKIYTAMVTPFRADAEIDFDLLENLINWQKNLQVDGLLFCGTNGEFSSLSFDEVQSIIRFVSETKDEDFEIIAGTGRSSLKETISLCKFAEELADLALIVPPYYFKDVDLVGLYNYFKSILEETKIPIILYNIPKNSGIEIKIELLTKLQKYNNFLGVKDSSGQLENTKNFIDSCPNLSVFAGSDALILPSFTLGVKGAISALAQLFPKEILEIRDCFNNHETDACATAQETILKIREIIKQFPNRAAIKYGLSLRGFNMSSVRPPLADLTSQQQKELKKKLSPFISN